MIKVMQKLFGGVVNEQNYAEFLKELGKRFVPKAEYNARVGELKELKQRVNDQQVSAEELTAAKATALELAGQVDSLQQLRESEHEAYELLVQRAKIERLAELALLRSGARNLKATMALLELESLTPGKEDAELKERVEELVRAEETCFLFERRMEPTACEWQGFVPMEAADMPDTGYAGGFRLRLAQAQNASDCLAAIKVKQEAAAKGVIL